MNGLDLLLIAIAFFAGMAFGATNSSARAVADKVRKVIAGGGGPGEEIPPK